MGFHIAAREWCASWLQDTRIAIRGLRARPGFTATVLITLAFGIGANAAIFSVVDSVLLRPLPFAQPDRLVHLWETYESKVDSRSEASYPDYLDWRARNRSFTDLAGYEGSGHLMGGSEPMMVMGVAATANFFDVLGVHPILGRGFLAGEDAPDAPRVAIVSYGFWQRQLGGSSTALGRVLILDGAPATVIGVLPKDFRFDTFGNAELWTTIDRDARTRAYRGNHWLNVVARLKPGVSHAQAVRDLSAIMRDLAREYPETNAGRDGQVVPLQKEFVGSIQPIILLLYGAVIVVLVIACVNVANLLLIRGADREREMAVRAALGAGRRRLVRQLLTESLILGLAGGLLGLGVAQLGLRWLTGAIPQALERQMSMLTHVRLDATIVVYGILVALVAGIIFGIVPALRVTSNSSDALKGGGRGSTASSSRLRDGLVIGELALTVVLLSGATLFGRSLIRLLQINPGFRAEHLLTGTVVLPNSGYRDRASIVSAFERLTDRVRSTPGVASVGLISRLPLQFGGALGFDIIGQSPAAHGNEPSATFRKADVGYFGTAGIPLVRGRTFAGGDRAGAPTAVVVNRALAKAYFGNADPIGQRLYAFRDTVTIVGIVGDVSIGGVDARIPPTLYVAFAQVPQPYMGIAVRGGAPVAELTRGLRAALAAVDPAAALTGVAMMTDVIGDSQSVFLRRYALYLVGAFALTAFVLAIVGIYGVVSYAVRQRWREMGIRMALGAPTMNLIGLVMSHGGRMAIAGIGMGVVGAVVAGRMAGSLLYGITSTDPLTYMSAALVLGATALCATLIPARRATRVDPSVTLRDSG